MQEQPDLLNQQPQDATPMSSTAQSEGTALPHVQSLVLFSVSADTCPAPRLSVNHSFWSLKFLMAGGFLIQTMWHLYNKPNPL